MEAVASNVKAEAINKEDTHRQVDSNKKKEEDPTQQEAVVPQEEEALLAIHLVVVLTSKEVEATNLVGAVFRPVTAAFNKVVEAAQMLVAVEATQQDRKTIQDKEEIKVGTLQLLVKIKIKDTNLTNQD